ncbi:MAG: hypothetical protein CR967_03960 [Proteobacteria bacterium]|nr:MAG: hypothetical protein CR967_03960 [Pseudomonadota bacterium]
MKDLELKNIVKYNKKEFLVSTIATPIRHTWFEDDDRIVYETMVFPLDGDDVDYEKPLFNERYHTAEEAIADHSLIIKNPQNFIE